MAELDLLGRPRRVIEPLPEVMPDFRDMTIQSLKDFADKHGIHIYGVTKKADIIEKMNEKVAQKMAFQEADRARNAEHEARMRDLNDKFVNLARMQAEKEKTKDMARAQVEKILTIMTLIDSKEGIEPGKKYDIYKVLSAHLIKVVIIATQLGVELPQLQQEIDLPGKKGLDLAEIAKLV